MIQQVAYPFCPKWQDSYQHDDETASSYQPFNWLKLILFLVLAVCGGYFVWLYIEARKEKQHQIAKELERQD